MPGKTPNGNVATNGGGKFIDTIDPEDPEYQRQLMRPAEIKEDLNLMDQRKRVSLILNSEAFKTELEEIINSQLKSGAHPASLLALQQISDLLLTSNKPGGNNKSLGMVATPINDIRGSEAGQYDKGERLVRCKLASAYRLVDLHGWSEGIYNHISACTNKEQGHFLVNPFGLQYSEITSSSLVKVDVKGEVIDKGTTVFGISQAGWVIHSAIHEARPDVKAIIHVHVPQVIAIANSKHGLLPLCQEACVLGETSFYDFHGIVADEEQKQGIVDALGPSNKVLFLRQHGVCVCGESVEEAWFLLTLLMTAVQTQIQSIQVAGSIDNLYMPSPEAVAKAREIGAQGAGGVNTKAPSGHKWRRGEMEFEAAMRELDAAGFRTGYIYHEPVIRTERRLRRHDDVEIPPSSSSFTYVFDGDVEHSKLQSAKQILEKGPHGEYINTPNTYTRKEIDEIGTDNPAKIVKWVKDAPEDGKGGGTPVKLTEPNVFAPQGKNPKEFKQQQKKVKDGYYNDKLDSGPASKILEGMTNDEILRMKEAERAKAHETQQVVVGAASKGIIAREHQHNAVVYKDFVSPNPFRDVTDDQLNQYEDSVLHKKDGSKSESGDNRTANLESIPEDKLSSPKAVVSDSEAAIHMPHFSRKKPSTLTPKGDTMKSDTSGAEESHDDSATDKKKKKGFRIPSFSGKDKKEKKKKAK